MMRGCAAHSYMFLCSLANALAREHKTLWGCAGKRSAPIPPASAREGRSFAGPISPWIASVAASIRASASSARSSRWVFHGAHLPSAAGAPHCRAAVAAHARVTFADTSVFVPLGEHRVPAPSIPRANER
jgi:hypothetical protein